MERMRIDTKKIGGGPDGLRRVPVPALLRAVCPHLLTQERDQLKAELVRERGNGAWLKG